MQYLHVASQAAYLWIQIGAWPHPPHRSSLGPLFSMDSFAMHRSKVMSRCIIVCLGCEGEEGHLRLVAANPVVWKGQHEPTAPIVAQAIASGKGLPYSLARRPALFASASRGQPITSSFVITSSVVCSFADRGLLGGMQGKDGGELRSGF